MFWNTPKPLHDHPPHPVQDLLARLDAVCLPLLAAIAAALRPLLHRVPLAARIHLARTRLNRARNRIVAILAQCRAGTWQDPRPRAPRPVQPSAAARKRAPAPYLPRRRGWLGHVTDTDVRCLASQFTHLLNDPGTAHILAQAPPHARAAIARTLRGPARLLALDLPSCLQFAGPPRAPRVRPPKPPRPPLPEMRPIPRNVLRAARYYRRIYGRGG